MQYTTTMRSLSQFLHDMIHLTEGEKLVKYWWLWLDSYVVLTLLMLWSVHSRRSREICAFPRDVMRMNMGLPSGVRST